MQALVTANRRMPDATPDLTIPGPLANELHIRAAIAHRLASRLLSSSAPGVHHGERRVIEATPRRPPEPLGCYGFGRNQGTVDDHAEVSLLSNPSEKMCPWPTTLTTKGSV